MPIKKPNSRRNLDIAIERLCGRENFVAKRGIIANAIVSQMLPSSAVKGGSAIKMRLGDAATRFTADLDVARATSIDDFQNSMQDALACGWEGFTGTLVAGKQARPKNVPEQYVMQPFFVKLNYNNKPWMTVDLEVGFNEIGDAEDPDLILPKDANDLLVNLGFPAVDPVPVMALEHQIAQKLHAVSTPSDKRAHDLIDLQLLDGAYSGDYSDIKNVCERLFRYRNMQTWPPVIKKSGGWGDLYSAQLPKGALFSNVDDAIAWANELIQKIDEA